MASVTITMLLLLLLLLCCWTHKDEGEGEGEGARWCARTRVMTTTTTTMLLCKGNNVVVVIVIVVVLSHLHCRVVRHVRMGGQGRWWGSESERAIAISRNTWPRVWVRVRVPTSCTHTHTHTHTLWIPVPETLVGQPYLCYCLICRESDDGLMHRFPTSRVCGTSAWIPHGY